MFTKKTCTHLQHGQSLVVHKTKSFAGYGLFPFIAKNWMESPREMMGQNCSPSVNIKIAGKWIFIPVHECYWLVVLTIWKNISQLGRIIPYNYYGT